MQFTSLSPGHKGIHKDGVPNQNTTISMEPVGKKDSICGKNNYPVRYFVVLLDIM
jgi:hypothetical protein